MAATSVVEKKYESLADPLSWAHPPPKSFAVAFSDEAKATLSSIRTYLPLSIELHDHDRTLSFLRRIDSYLDRKVLPLPITFTHY